MVAIPGDLKGEGWVLHQRSFFLHVANHRLNEPEISTKIADALFREARGFKLMSKNVANILEDDEVSVSVLCDRTHQTSQIDFGRETAERAACTKKPLDDCVVVVKTRLKGVCEPCFDERCNDDRRGAIGRGLHVVDGGQFIFGLDEPAARVPFAWIAHGRDISRPSSWGAAPSASF